MFDPYRKWLGIPREEQPPNHYRLLGLSLFETDLEVIDAATNRQMAYLQVCATGTYSLLSQRLLNEVASARLCLLTPEKKATYDARLKGQGKRSNGNEASAPASTILDQVPAPGVRRNTSDTRYPVLEGIDEEAEPYEIIPLPAVLPRSRSYRRKSSKLPTVALILVSVAALAVITKTLFDLGSRTNRDTDNVLVERNPESPRQVDPADQPGFPQMGVDSVDREVETRTTPPEVTQREELTRQELPSSIALFNGNDLTGWVAIRQGQQQTPGQVFRVDQGELVSDRSAGGYLRTVDYFRDFVLTLEYKFPKGGQLSNSGSGLLLVGGDEPGSSLGIECQVMPGQTGDLYAFPGISIGSVERTPQGLEIIRRISNAERPIGEWNDYEIRCEGPKISLMLNGRIVNRATSERPIHSRIGLMCQQSDVRFRNIRLRTNSIKSTLSIPPPSRTPAPPWNATVFDGHSYMFFPDVVRWHQAKARCEEMGGHLATIESREENEFVLNLAKKSIDRLGALDSVWLGATDEVQENHWKWVDGSKSSFTKWAIGQPNNKDNNEHYLLLWLPNDVWCDQPDDSKQHVTYFVCEWDRGL